MSTRFERQLPQEIATDVYLNNLPTHGKIRRFTDNILISASNGSDFSHISTLRGYVRHLYCSEGQTEVLINGHHVAELKKNEVLQIGPNCSITAIDKANQASIQIIAHKPKHFDDQTLHQHRNDWLVRGISECTYGYWVGAFVSNDFPLAQTSELAAGVKTLHQGKISETQPHSHLNQEELNAVIDGAYSLDIYEAYSDNPKTVTVHAGQVLTVKRGIFSGTRNIDTKTDTTKVYLIQSPNLQPGEDDKNFTNDDQEIKGPTWTKKTLTRRKN